MSSIRSFWTCALTSVSLISLSACASFAPFSQSTAEAEPAAAVKEAKANTPKTYEPNWDSLTDREFPEWLLDAKFGIYAHWGLYSVPAFYGEWYGRVMYDPDGEVIEEHTKRYGGPDKFGYKDFADDFTAEHFDAAEWADLMEASGAKYAGIAVVHHDGFALWDSEHGDWDVGDRGPKRDLFGDLVTELNKRDLKTIATFHQFRQFNWFVPDKMLEDEELARASGYDLFDPENSGIYWNKYVANFDDFIDHWRARVSEVIDKYHPDVIWFDSGAFRSVGKEDIVMDVLAEHFNDGQKRGAEVEVMNKMTLSGGLNFPDNFGIWTYEEGRDRAENTTNPWVDDMKVSADDRGWGYLENQTYRKPGRVIDGLVDRVARGGGLLLSLSPKADGTLPEGQKSLLLEIGEWLKVNGEAIYGTRPWKTEAEGPVARHIHFPYVWQHKTPSWHFEHADWEDIRFTTKGDDLYAIALGWPEHGELFISALRDSELKGSVSKVTLLGHDEPIKFQDTPIGLRLIMPEKRPNEYAYTFKIHQTEKVEKSNEIDASFFHGNSKDEGKEDK